MIPAVNKEIRDIENQGTVCPGAKLVEEIGFGEFAVEADVRRDVLEENWATTMLRQLARMLRDDVKRSAIWKNWVQVAEIYFSGPRKCDVLADPFRPCDGNNL